MVSQVSHPRLLQVKLNTADTQRTVPSSLKCFGPVPHSLVPYYCFDSSMVVDIEDAVQEGDLGPLDRPEKKLILRKRS